LIGILSCQGAPKQGGAANSTSEFALGLRRSDTAMSAPMTGRGRATVLVTGERVSGSAHGGARAEVRPVARAARASAKTAAGVATASEAHRKDFPSEPTGKNMQKPRSGIRSGLSIIQI
jgi:hypothetical protein